MLTKTQASGLLRFFSSESALSAWAFNGMTPSHDNSPVGFLIFQPYNRGFQVLHG
jgi:hypothetical protein